MKATYLSSSRYLSALHSSLVMFVPSFITYKDEKEERRIRDAYSHSLVYIDQLNAVSILKEIEISHLLGQNDVVIPHLVQEYARLRIMLRKVEAGFAKMKQFPEAISRCNDISRTFEKDKIGSYLKDDLILLSTTFSIDIDLNVLLGNFKSYSKE